ncbi:hypothetical protein GGI05_003870, partial [Coemansia sp. RSA 2603]
VLEADSTVVVASSFVVAALLSTADSGDSVGSAISAGGALAAQVVEDGQTPGYLVRRTAAVPEPDQVNFERSFSTDYD